MLSCSKRTNNIYPEIKGKVVIVTGGANGIGLAMAKTFARNDAHIMLLDINEDALEKAAVSLTQGGEVPFVDTFQASVDDEEAVERAFSFCLERFGQIDILLNNAGISVNKPSLELSAEEWRRGIAINLNGVFFCAQAAAKRMIQQKGGVIINTASMYGLVSAPERAAYCAAKAGVVSLTKTLAVEWASYGIRVNAIGPGYTLTPLVEELGQKGRLDLESLCRKTPLGRLGTPEEMAKLALFLASDTAGFVTGHTLVADGGWTANGYL